MITLTEKQIKEIADFLDCGLICLYNKKTKELITITEFDDYPNSDEVNWDDLIKFENLNSDDSFKLMADFVEQIDNNFLKEKLINVLNRSKPFKNFKMQIDNSGEYRQKWFDFKNRKYVDYVKSQIETINENENSESDLEEQIDFEIWEIESRLYDREDWVGLLELQKRRAEKDPTDLQRQEKYAIALNLNQQYNETLKLLKPLNRKYHCFGINEIMEALLGLNKTEKDFNWAKKPRILKLDEKTLKLCVKYLKGKKKPRSALDICNYLDLNADFSYFDKEALANYLSKYTNIFDLIEDSSELFDIRIILKKKK